MKKEDVRLINAYNETGRLFVHLNNGKTVRRTISGYEIITANRIRNTQGYEKYVEYYVDLINSKYSQPDAQSKSYLSDEETEFWMLHHMKQIIPLDIEAEERYQQLLWSD